MSTVITWAVAAIDCYPQEAGYTDVVSTVHWVCSGVQEQNGKIYSASVYATCAVPLPSGEFTPYDQLTKDQVLGWCYANGVDQAAAEEAVRGNINLQLTPTTVSLAPPWAT